MDPNLKDIHDLTPDNNYIVTAYKQSRGSCGIYYIIKTRLATDDVTEVLVTVRSGNNIYDYLNKKDDVEQFNIRKTLSPTDEYYFIINRNIGAWVDLIEKSKKLILL